MWRGIGGHRKLGDEFYIDHFASDGHIWGLLTHGRTTAYGWFC